jgi:hypothetical protein
MRAYGSIRHSHGGFGEAGSGILARRQGKPGVSTFGMQTVIIRDVHRNRIRAYTHRHKVWKTKKLNPIGWNKEGPCELRRILEALMPMVVGAEEKPNCRQIFQEKPLARGIIIFPVTTSWTSLAKTDVPRL